VGGKGGKTIKAIKRNNKTKSISQQHKVVQFVVVRGNVRLELRGVHPRHIILHTASDKEGGVDDCLRPASHMALLDHCSGLLQTLRHLGANHLRRKKSKCCRSLSNYYKCPTLTTARCLKFLQTTQICSLITMTGNRRRQNAEAVTLSATAKLVVLVMSPMLNSFSSSMVVCVLR